MVELVGGGGGQGLEGVFEPNPGVEAELLARGREAGQGGEGPSTAVGSEKKEVLAAEGERLYGPLSRIVVCAL